MSSCTFSFDRIIIKVSGKQDRHKTWEILILGLWFPWSNLLSLGVLDDVYFQSIRNIKQKKITNKKRKQRIGLC